jgi:catecholate siderophore receptor
MSDSVSATKTLTSLRDVPQSLSVVGRRQLNDQMLTTIRNVVRYQPGITAHQGENSRDQILFAVKARVPIFVNGVRDDVQYLQTHTI